MPQQPPPHHPLIRTLPECTCQSCPCAATDAERVQKIRDAMNRHLAGLQKAVNDALDLVEERKKAA